MTVQLKYSYLTTFGSMGDVAATLRTRSTNSSLTSARCNGFRAASTASPVHCVYSLAFELSVNRNLKTHSTAARRANSVYREATAMTRVSFSEITFIWCRSQWSLGLRRRSTVARLLSSWVRIPPGAWMSVCCKCCVLSGTGLCDGLNTRPEESYRL